MQLEFICSNCGCITHLYSSSQVQDSRRREINVRLGIGGALCGLAHHGIMKLLGALNLPPPTQEQKYSETQEFILNYIEKGQEQSMIAAVKEAVVEAGGARELTVSGDGAWLTRGHSSVHEISALCSTTKRPKVLDTIWSYKKCAKCQGAESLRHVNPALFKTFQENHECQLNYIGSSRGMEKEMIHEMFCRSLSKYNTTYISYIGDGDAKIHKYLMDNPPYSDINIKKLEDTNHFEKRMLNRIMKVKRENKNMILSDGKRFSSKGRMTDTQAIKFKIYFAKAIRESKTDLNKLYQKSWAIFKHHYSTDGEPMHDWYDPQWCKYRRATSAGQQIKHSKAPIPQPCLDMIKPLFEELCSHTSLARVIDGGKLDMLRLSSASTIKKRHIKRAKITAAVTNTASSESDGDILCIANEENVDDIVNDVTLELNDITLELSQDDITDAYEAGGDD
ncbi:unnamed protein product [Rotaria sordida]|uniref:Mutator-like transposase domain-containing protein n=1 Tax=Rotaria sordida TaxID=392033 RepID=A0A815CI48_9BILA|nr:unnamed protein product [Rotaria sordida]